MHHPHGTLRGNKSRTSQPPSPKKTIDTQNAPSFKSRLTYFFHMRRRGGSRYYVHVCCCPGQMARSLPVAALEWGRVPWLSSMSLWRSRQTPWRPETRWCVLDRGGHSFVEPRRVLEFGPRVWGGKGVVGGATNLGRHCLKQSPGFKAPNFGG